MALNNVLPKETGEGRWQIIDFGQLTHQFWSSLSPLQASTHQTQTSQDTYNQIVDCIYIQVISAVDFFCKNERIRR